MHRSLKLLKISLSPENNNIDNVLASQTKIQRVKTQMNNVKHEISLEILQQLKG